MGGVLLGVGVAAAALAVVAGVLYEGHAERWNDDDTCLPPSGTRADGPCAGEYDAANTAGVVGVTSAATAGLMLAVGATLLGIGVASGGGESASVSCSPGLGGVWCRGRF